jgi:hypothetical protein
MFIQVMHGKCSDPALLQAQLDVWKQTLAAGADGWLGSTAGVTDDGEAVAVVRFESREAANANSGRPEQGEWWEATAKAYDGEVSFHDYDDAVTFLDGGSDDAGFVQVMHGKVADAAKFRAFMSQPMDQLQTARPEIIGGTVAVADDGDFTQTISFTSEAAAREGEKKEMPEEMQQQMAEGMGEMTDITYYDLRHPWLDSPG